MIIDEQIFGFSNVSDFFEGRAIIICDIFELTFDMLEDSGIVRLIVYKDRFNDPLFRVRVDTHLLYRDDYVPIVGVSDNLHDALLDALEYLIDLVKVKNYEKEVSWFCSEEFFY